MLPVEILPVQETIVLRARGSELLILPHHVKKLKGCVKSREFSTYFCDEALVNRPARKLFEAWLRKDQTLWQRLYKTVHTDMDVKADDDAADAAPAPKEAAPAKADKPAEKAEKKEAKAEKKEDKKEAKTEKVEKAEKKEAKPEKKAEKADKKEAKPEKKAEKKEAKPEKKAEKAEKKPAKKDDKPAAKAKAAAGAKKKK